MKLTVLFFSQLITAIFCYNCPPGLLWHQKVSRCCQPVIHCEPGHQVKSCMEFGKLDICEPCLLGYSNSFNTSSFDMKACQRNKCRSETTLNKDGECVCNLLKGYTGENSKLCLNEGEKCPKGTELQLNGNCKSCASGYYKDWKGYGFCKKQINCDLLQLHYEEPGNSQTAATCKTQQTRNKEFNDSNPRIESVTLSVHHPLMNMPEIKSELQPITENAFKSETLKNNLSTKQGLFTCDFQIIVVVLGILLFISTILIVYFIITRKARPTSKQINIALPLKQNISEVGLHNNKQRPLPVLPKHEIYSTPDADQYIPMNASKHPHFCTNRNIHEHTETSKQQDNLACHGKDLYMSSPLNESAYVKIEPLSFNYII